MALRDISASGEMPTSGGSSAVVGLQALWDSTLTAPKTEWVEWWGNFMVAATIANFSISVNEILRTATEQQPRLAALINNLNEQAAEMKLVIFLSLGLAAIRSLTDKFPDMRVAQNR